MEHPLGMFVLLATSALWLDGNAFAQTATPQPNAGQVTQQFKTGANHIGDGFVQMGEGIKQGAILSWQAVHDGTTAAIQRFNGTAPAPPLVQQTQ